MYELAVSHKKEEVKIKMTREKMFVSFYFEDALKALYSGYIQIGK